jgi:predicted nucleic acid-binding protein
MVAVDTSTVVAYLSESSGTDVEQFDAHLSAGSVALPPVALSELLSDPLMPSKHRALVLRLPKIEITEGYWVRAAATRSIVLAQKLRARLPDALIVQSCLDADLPLITRDTYFGHFARLCGLKLA